MEDGRFFRLGRWRFFFNVHSRRTLKTHYLSNPNHGNHIRSLVVLGVELSWWQAA